MCSLGHHQEGDDIRPPRRRHLDGSASAALAETPRQTLADRKKAKHAALAAEMAKALEVPMDDDQFQMNFEPLPPGADQLPDHLIQETKPPYWVEMS